MGTPEAKATLARLTPELAIRTKRFRAESRRRAIRSAGDRAINIWPLVLLSGLGTAQLFAWRHRDNPTSARAFFATTNTAILGAATGTGLGLATAALSFGHAKGGLGEALAIIGTGLVVGTAAFAGSGYLGYRLRANRRFYLGIAITETSLPLLLGLLHVLDVW